MLQKGTYTLKAPLETLSAMIEEKDMACAHAFLDLLSTTYALETSYNRTVYLTHTLPRAVDGFARSRRLWQIRGLARIIRADERLADAYLQGLASGLHLLSEAALNQFLDQAIRQYRHAPDHGTRFLALESRRAMEICRALQVAVPLSAVRAGLERYLQARTGLAVAIRPLSSLSEKQPTSDPGAPLVRCDGRAIYLPDEMDLMERRTDNAALYKLLAKLEAGAIEFGTYDLDVEKTLDTAAVAPGSDAGDAVAAESDLSRFLRGFEHPILALDLFTLCEHARIARKVSRRYPGLFRRLTKALTDPDLQARTGIRIGGTWFPLYRQLVMNEEQAADPALKSTGQVMADRLNQATSSGDRHGGDQCTADHGILSIAGRSYQRSRYACLSPPDPAFRPPAGTAFFRSFSHHLSPPGRRYPQPSVPTEHSRLPVGHPAPARPAERPDLGRGPPRSDREPLIGNCLFR